MDLVLVTHAHFDHLHRQSLRAIARQTRRQTGVAPTLVVPHHLFDLVSDLGFEQIVELEWWNTYRHGGLDITHVPSRIGERASSRIRTAATAATCCAAANTPSTTPETPPISPAFARLDAACRPNSRCFHRRLQPRAIPQCTHQSRRRHESLSRSEVALDGAHALRIVSPVA